jgi:hypothetical protein
MGGKAARGSGMQEGKGKLPIVWRGAIHSLRSVASFLNGETIQRPYPQPNTNIAPSLLFVSL